MRSVFLIVLLLLCANAFATHVAVLETMADGDTKDSLSLLDRQYLTNVLREQAVKELPAEQNFTIMTRENISAMLPPGKAVEDCEGSCLAETGRNISADYVCQARVGRFGSKLTLSAELYETAGNKLVTSFNGRGADVEELLRLIEEKSPEFFRRIKELNKPVVAPDADKVSDPIDEPAESAEGPAESKVTEPAEVTSTDSVRAEAAAAYDELDGKDASRVGESIPANINDEPAKKGGVHWVPLSISAAATLTGVVLAVVGNNKAKDASDKEWTTKSEFQKNRDDAESGQTLRNIGIGVAIVGAVGIGLSFAF